MIHTKRISIHGGSVAVTLKPPIPNGTQGAGEKSSWRKERRGKWRCCLITARMYPFCTKEGWLPWAAFATSLRPHLMLSSLVVLLQARRLLDGSGEAKICWNESEWGDSCSQKNKWGPTALVEIFSTPQVKTSTCCCGCSHWKEYAFFPPWGSEVITAKCKLTCDWLHASGIGARHNVLCEKSFLFSGNTEALTRGLHLPFLLSACWELRSRRHIIKFEQCRDASQSKQRQQTTELNVGTGRNPLLLARCSCQPLKLD